MSEESKSNQPNQPQEAPAPKGVRPGQRFAPAPPPEVAQAENTSPARPKGHEGGLLVHIIDLASALRHQDWGAALGYFSEILGMISPTFHEAPPAPVFAREDAGAGAGQVAEALERFAKDHSGVRGATEAGAIPWGDLLMLLKLVLDVILSKRA